jgi:hypothetical protein
VVIGFSNRKQIKEIRIGKSECTKSERRFLKTGQEHHEDIEVE